MGYETMVLTRPKNEKLSTFLVECGEKMTGSVLVGMAMGGVTWLAGRADLVAPVVCAGVAVAMWAARKIPQGEI